MIRPYPFASLARIDRASAAMLRRCAHRIPDFDPRAMRETAAELMGTPVAFEPLPPEVRAVGKIPVLFSQFSLVVVLERGAGGPSNRALLEVPGRLAAVVVDRTLGGDAERTFGQELFEPDELSRGVLSYLVARLLGSSGSDWRLREILPAKRAGACLHGIMKAVLWPIDLAIGSHRESARFWLPDAAVDSLFSGSSSGIAKPLLGIEMKLVATAGKALLRRSDLESLRVKDVMVLDRCELRLERGDWVGSVELMLDRAGRTVWRCFVEDGKLRITSVCRREELPMGEGSKYLEADAAELAQLAGDAPIEISVELARFTLPLDEIGTLRPGVILETGRPIGERVTVRIGGRAVASGELLDVDGSIGVRILSTGG